MTGRGFAHIHPASIGPGQPGRWPKQRSGTFDQEGRTRITRNLCVATIFGATNRPGSFMNSLAPASLALLLCAFLTAACGSAQRTADGDCYYAGKGALQVLATVGDAAAEWADATLELQYQREQIELAELNEQLRQADRGWLVREYNRAIRTEDTYRAISLQNEISLLDLKSNRRSYLVSSIKRYQERRQRELARGPQKSISQMVDESGECE